MGQELLVKIDMPVKASARGKSPLADSSAKQDTAETKPFSSTLDEQLENQAVEQQQPAKSPVSVQAKKTKSVDSEQPAVEQADSENGNNLPQQVSDEATIELLTSSDNKQVSDDNKQVSDDNKQVSDHNLHDSEDEGNEASTVNIIPEVNSEDITLLDDALVKHQAEIIKQVLSQTEKPKPAANVNKPHLKTQEAIEAIKATIVADDSNAELKTLSPEPKRQVAALRSDILNALVKKTGGENDKLKFDDAIIKTEKTITAQMFDNPVRKMADLLTQQQQETPLLKPLTERHVSGGLATALTAATISSAVTIAAQTSSPAQPVLAMQPSMQTQAWGKVLSSRVIWMAREGVQQAELRLNPANLGPVEVKLHMNNEQANVTFIAQNAATRDALEQALPRLRESFQENGMNLANANVSDQQAEQNNDQEKSDNSSTASQLKTDELDAENNLIESNELELGVSVFA